ncbi:hypothetical protein BKA67DRAFT_650036 [Truncatella angustata]|uniref:Uncharacterized protein n=1 Tax=Truncatella angustata TaxID=152316 RepID=A0A9P8U9Y2_9PEZI|nr:uncharacterized protein BKA67DRAFT_650036 [Truncatella angustata]KAH6646804.1 hypothetical protein BKA67DRAFT_650036 [Truncatella angustata]
MNAHSPSVSFLFIVNEINLNLDLPPTADRWGNLLPPLTSRGFKQETVGQVFRYSNGTVTAATGYYWFRQRLELPGTIGRYGARYDAFGNVVSDEMGFTIQDFYGLDEYSTTTLFNCGPFLPCVLSHGDPSVEGFQDFSGWNALHFTHKEVISQASSSGSHTIVAGPSASFIDALLPRVCQNNNHNAPRSRGLGGELGLSIGLMALSQGLGSIDAAFHNNDWDGNCWTGQRHVSAWPAADEDPRGVIVHIALDPEAGWNSSIETISNFEWDDLSGGPRLSDEAAYFLLEDYLTLNHFEKETAQYMEEAFYTSQFSGRQVSQTSNGDPNTIGVSRSSSSSTQASSSGGSCESLGCLVFSILCLAGHNGQSRDVKDVK